MDFKVKNGRANISVPKDKDDDKVINLVGVKQYGGFRGALLRFFGYASEIKGAKNTVIFVNTRSLFKKLASVSVPNLNGENLKSKIQSLETILATKDFDAGEIGGVEDMQKLYKLVLGA